MSELRRLERRRGASGPLSALQPSLPGVHPTGTFAIRTHNSGGTLVPEDCESLHILDLSVRNFVLRLPSQAALVGRMFSFVLKPAVETSPPRESFQVTLQFPEATQCTTRVRTGANITISSSVRSTVVLNYPYAYQLYSSQGVVAVSSSDPITWQILVDRNDGSQNQAANGEFYLADGTQVTVDPATHVLSSPGSRLTRAEWLDSVRIYALGVDAGSLVVDCKFQRAYVLLS